jgi:luciferase family oxidoreductase group 1
VTDTAHTPPAPPARRLQQTIRLSALDTALIGQSAEQALADSVGLARHAERLGFARYWLAEHHGPSAGAGSAPVITAAAVASATTTINVGTGGVMIPNHVPLTVAEQFGTLAALFPGRIDLGVGRAAPPDRATAAVLARYLRDYGADDFADRIDQLIGFLTGEFPSRREFGELHVAPRVQQPPAVWVLGTSDSAAGVAAAFGVPFAFGHHFGRGDAVSAIEYYQAQFQPSATLADPYTIVTLLAVAADTDERAARLADSADLYFHTFFSTGRALPRLPSIQETQEHHWTAAERRFAEGRRAGQAVGSREQVGAVITDLLERTGADELMLTTQMPRLEDRVRSLELVSSLLPEITTNAGKLAA